MTRQTLEYADPALVERYPGAVLSAQDRRKFDEGSFEVAEILTRPDVLLYGLGQALSVMFTSSFETLAEVVGKEAALDVARQVGRKHAAKNYGQFLKSRGYEGGAKAFCEYQDYGHSLRGPRHVSALFAEYNENSVLVTREDCVYFWGERGQPNKYVEALESGMYEGYREVDPLFEGVENSRCLCKGSPDGCQHLFIFRTGR